MLEECTLKDSFICKNVLRNNYKNIRMKVPRLLILLKIYIFLYIFRFLKTNIWPKIKDKFISLKINYFILKG